jgi:Type I phosphodiesterase / nucleotide pyrophosphatase
MSYPVSALSVKRWYVDRRDSMEISRPPKPRTRPRRLSWLVSRLGLSRSDYPDERRGFIGIQIDGLGYYVIKGALTRRYLPFLRKLQRRRGWALHRYKVGLPATTPASQLGIMYGDNDDVPGFRWLEKDTQSLRITKSTAVCAEVEKRVSARVAARGGGGILRHGASYCNMFSGDAASSTLTLSTLGQARSGQLRWRDLLVLFVLYLGLVFRVIALSFWEALLELYDQMRAVQDGRPVRDEGVFPLVRAATNVVFREIATQGCLLDIYRGVPFVYLNYSGYDEVAHHRGPVSTYAKLVLRTIDRQIARIVHATERYGARPYDVILLSDHGQSTTIPWEHLHGQSLAEFILEHAVSARLVPLGADHRSKQVGRALAFASWLREMEWMLPRPLGRVVRFAAGWMAERLPDEAAGIDWSADVELMVAPTGSLCHVYFTGSPAPLTLAQIREKHSALVDALVAHPSIAAVAARSGDGGVTILSARGSLRSDAGGRIELLGEHPLDAYLEGRDSVGDVVRLVSFAHAGDLVLFSAKEGGRVVNFQVEMGSHGGLHLDEQSGFVMVPPNIAFDFSEVHTVRDLYRLFEAYHAEAGENQVAAS